MSDKKPVVFPQQQKTESNTENFGEQKKEVVSEIFDNYSSVGEISNSQAEAVEAMRRRTEAQLNNSGQIVYPELAEKSNTAYVKQTEEIYRKAQEQKKIRDEKLSETYGNFESKENKVNTPVKKPMEETKNFGKNPANIDKYIAELSQPTMNTAFDVIPLPSEGKLYRMKKPNVRVSFMTTADENILTSPNLLQSGQFLEILINRKLLETDIRYNDLHIGDRNAIMIWLRATSYGEMYPVTLLDESGEPFETEINLNDLKLKPLKVEPDENGLFDFEFPLSKNKIKFRLLTCADAEIIEERLEEDKKNEIPVNNYTSYFIERTIVSVNGNTDRNFIKDYSESIRIKDAKALLEYIENIESGIDLNISVVTPSGHIIETFLPLNVTFFWPNFKL